MKILFTSNLADMGGGETSTLKIMTKLAETHSVTLLCNSEGPFTEMARQNRIEVIVYNFKKRNIFNSLRFIEKLILSHNIDIIHNNECSAALLFGVAARFVNKKVKNYWTCHGQWYRFGSIKRLLIPILINKIFCVSENVRNNLLSQKIRPQQLVLTYLGVDQHEVYQKGLLRKTINVPKDETIIGTVARYAPIKGQMKAIDAIIPLLEENERTHYVLIGGCLFGSQAANEYYEKVLTKINNSSVHDRIHVMGERKNAIELMADFDLLLVPSDNESLSMVTIEALNQGVPVISTPCDGPEEILEHDRILICDENNSKSIYNKLKLFLLDEEYRKTVIQKSCLLKERVHSLFDIDNVCRKYLRVFEEL